MGLLLRDCTLYLESEPHGPSPAVPSRVIDILYDDDDVVTSHSTRYSKAVDLIKSFEQGQNPDIEGTSLDRIYIEQNWPFARNYLCRRFLKVQSRDLTETWPPAFESLSSIDFQTFLLNPDKQDPDEISFPLSASPCRLSRGRDRLLYHFGFDWVTIGHEMNNGQSEGIIRNLITADGSSKPILLRRTCVAAIVRMRSTGLLDESSLCPNSWNSRRELNHRRTVIFFNDFHPSERPMEFSSWLGCHNCPELWSVTEPWNVRDDDEATAVKFIYQLSYRVWTEILRNWWLVAHAALLHVRELQKNAISENMSTPILKKLARDTWSDTLAWATLQTLVGVHMKMILKNQRDLKSIAALVQVNIDDYVFDDILGDFKELERLFAEDLTKRAQSTSDVIFNIMGVETAQASHNYSKAIGRITWVSFVFFPLIAVSGLFGMNVDILADNPSFKWYFIIAIPALILVLAVTLWLQHSSRIIRFLQSSAGGVRDGVKERLRRSYGGSDCSHEKAEV